MVPPELLALAARQHGVVSKDQARAAGVSDRQLQRRVAAGTLEQPAPRVFVVGGAPPTWHRELMVGVLSVPGALVSHRTAAALRNLDGYWRDRVEVITEHGGWRRRDIVVHQSKDLVAADIDEVDGIPCTSLVRTLVDLPAVSHEFRAGQALDHACRRDRSILSQVRDRHLEVARRGRNGTVALRAMLERRSPGGPPLGSGFEAKMLHLIACSGLPDPVCQFEVRDGGFVAFLDLAWPELRIGIECDSLAHHFGEHAHQWDRTRRRRLKALGWDVYEFTYEDVTQRGLMVITELRQARDRAARRSA